MLISNLGENFSMNNVKAKVGLYEGSTLVTECTCSGKETALQKFTVSREGEHKLFGFGICQKLKLTLLDINRQLALTTNNSAVIGLGDGETFDSPYPTFYVSSVDRDEKNNNITVTAHDALYRASEHTYDELNINAPYTLYNLAEACATLLGLTLKMPDINSYWTEFYNTIYEKGGNYDGTESIRVVLNQIAEITTSIYYVNNNNELVFVQGALFTTVAEVSLTRDNYYELTTGASHRLYAIHSVTELGDNYGIDMTEHWGESPEATTVYIRENALAVNHPAFHSIMGSMISRYANMRWTEFECEWEGNYLLEIGDCIKLQTENGELFTMMYVNDIIEYDGALVQTSYWKYEDNPSETESTPANVGDVINQTFAKVDKVNRRIELVASSVDENTENISQLNITTQEISASVKSVQETTQSSVDAISGTVDVLTKEVGLAITADEVEIVVRKELEGGVDKVVTAEKRFTFDDEGLNISSSDSPINTTITEDGMTINKNNREVLVANNEGVKANDLHATTYLIIGETSRLEDYNNRTACFWVEY